MSVNIPKDPFSVDSSSASPSSHSPSTSPYSTSTKDSLEAASPEELMTRLTPGEKVNPELAIPQSPDTSILGAFRAWTEAARAFRDQLSASDSASLEARRKFSRLAALQAEEISKFIAEREAVLLKLQEEIKTMLGDFQKKMDEMQELAKKQQEKIDQINAGNGTEKHQYEKLLRAYEDYLSNLESIGAIDQGNGTFLIPTEPEDAKDQYNQFTKDYQQAVAKFNDYWKGRSQEINEYHTATTAYNQSVAEYNQALNDFIHQNNLSDELKKLGITLPQLVPASRRDLAGYQDWMEAPSTIITVPSFVSTYPPPAYVRSIAQAGPPPLPKLPSFSSFDSNLLYEGIYHRAYENEIAPFDQAIMQYNNYWSFITRQIENLGEDLSSDDLLNSKALVQQLLFPSSTPSKTSSSASSLAMQAMGIGNSHLQVILGQALLSEIVANSNLEALEGLSREEKETKINQLVDKILLLSVGILGNQSIQSLFPSLGIIAESLVSLPKDSPAFALLFAVSLSNRVQENIKQGISSEALQSLFSMNPEFDTLSTEDKNKLGASLNLGQLLIVGKLLEDNMGLQGLLHQILSSLLPAFDFQHMIPQAMQEVQQEHLEVQTRVKDHFVHQGYPEEAAQFLAQVGGELTQQGLLTPHLTANISEKTLNQPLLENSIKAALVIAHHPLPEAHAIASEAIQNTLSEGPYPSIKQFLTALDSHLTDLQVRNSSQIAKTAVVIPRAEPLVAAQSPSIQPIGMTSAPSDKPIAQTREARTEATLTTPPSDKPIAQTRGASTEAAPATPPLERPIIQTSGARTAATPAATPSSVPLQPASLSPNELTAILEKRTLQLLTPQLGFPLAKQISQEVTKTLFGEPQLRNRTEVASPYGWVNVLKDQLYHFNIENQEDWTNALHQTFKESIKTMESFYAFSLKLMDPAYHFIFASSLIYGDYGRKKAIDIPI
jgi:uncharacterized protein YukE